MSNNKQTQGDVAVQCSDLLAPKSVTYEQHYCTAYTLPDGNWTVIEHNNIMEKLCWKMSAALHELAEYLRLSVTCKFLHGVYHVPRAIALVFDVILVNFHGANDQAEPRGEPDVTGRKDEQ